MALEKMRRFVFALAAVALFLATVMPGLDMNSNQADFAPTMAMATMDSMDCPECDKSRDNMVADILKLPQCARFTQLPQWPNRTILNRRHPPHLFSNLSI
jgi:hypothetical protein